MEIDATKKNQEKNSKLGEMVKAEQGEINENGTAKTAKPKTDQQTKYQRPNYLLRLL